MDNRAQSIGISRYFLALGVGAAIVWIVREVSSPLLNSSANATSAAKVNQATVWFQQWLTYLPLFFLLVSGIGLVVLAIYQSQIQ